MRMRCKNVKYYEIFIKQIILQISFFLEKLYKSFQAFCFSKCQLVIRKKDLDLVKSI